MKNYWLPLVVIIAVSSFARSDEPPAYTNACNEAQQHAQHPSGWSVSNLKTITGPGDGNHWSNIATPDGTESQVLVRAFTNAQYYNRSTDATIGKYQQQFTRGALWVTTGDELPDFLKNNSVKASDAALRTAQLLGLPTKSITTDKYTSVVEMYVSPNKLWRPTKDADIRHQPTALPNGNFAVRPNYIPASVYNNYIKSAASGGWYLSNINSSYTPAEPPAYPWTQFGYTYDWGNNGTNLASIRGLSEFTVLGRVWNGTGYAAPWLTTGSVYTIQSYVYKTGGLGSGNFKITDSCDTIWAGTMFQPYGNTIDISSTGSVTGGEGILITSSGYTVNNSGSINGLTDAKYLTANNLYYAPSGSSIYLMSGGTVNNTATGIMKDDNIAINSAGGGTTVNNAGSISARDTAIKSTVSGSTLTVTNSGSIYGSSYAIRSGDGNDRVTVNNGGSIRGNIDLGTSTVSSGDTVTFNAGSTYTTITNPNDETATTIDAKNVDVQNAKLRVETIANHLPSVGDHYRIVNCDRLVGDKPFAEVESQFAMYSYYQFHPDNANYIDVLTMHNTYADVAGGEDDRLQELGSSLDGFVTAPEKADITTVLNTIDQQTSNAAVASAVRQLSPMVYTANPHVTFETDRAFYDTIVNRSRTLRDDIISQSAEPFFGADKVKKQHLAENTPPVDDMDSWNPYVDGFGTWGRQKSNNNVAGYRYDTWGGIAGMEKRLGRNFIVGTGVGGSRTNLNLKDEAGSNTTINGVRPMAYSGMNLGNFSSDLALGYGYNQYETDRKIQFDEINRTAQSTHDGHEVSSMLNLGYKFFVTKKTVIEPLTGAYYSWLHETGFQEKDANSTNLRVDSTNSSSLKSMLGARSYHDFELHENFIMRPEVSAKWLHEFMDSRFDSTASLSGGNSFTYRGQNLDRDYAQFGPKLNLRIYKRYNIYAEYAVLASPNFLSNSVNIGLNVTF